MQGLLDADPRALITGPPEAIQHVTETSLRLITCHVGARNWLRSNNDAFQLTDR